MMKVLYIKGVTIGQVKELIDQEQIQIFDTNEAQQRELKEFLRRIRIQTENELLEYNPKIPTIH